MRLLPPGGKIIGGRVVFHQQELTALSETRMQSIRGAGIAMMPQEQTLALHPLIRAVDQVAEVVRAHCEVVDDARSHAKELLQQMRLDGDGKLELAYPHEMSGGQRQRVLLAMTLAARPKLLIADEPTSAVDDEVRSEISLLIQQARERYGLSLLWITHRPEDVTAMADKVLVFYAGQLVEEAPAANLLEQPLHPYTRLLLACVPAQPGTKPTSKRMPVFSGPIGNVGCSFAPRCPDRIQLCSERQPPLVQLAGNRHVRCVRYAG